LVSSDWSLSEIVHFEWLLDFWNLETARALL
jgi:hypothetical protein